MQKVRIVGAGRAGKSFERALQAVGLEAELVPGRTLAGRTGAGRPSARALACAAEYVDAVLICVPDRAVGEVAGEIEPVATTAILHCSGSLGLDVLGPSDRHLRRGSLHPLATLPDPVVGSLRLRSGAFFAVTGDHAATDLVLLLGGHPIVVPEDLRVTYHAAASVAANHLVALLGQVERIAEAAGLPLEAFLPLARGALDDVAMLGPRAALTGPAARGDTATMDAHRRVLDESELDAYDALAALAERLAHGEPAEHGARVRS